MKQSGFSLLEVMVVIVIIGLFTAMIAPQFLGQQDGAELKKAAIDVHNLEGIVEMYKLQTGNFPTTDQGLEALVTRPTVDPIPRSYPQDGFTSSLPPDPWGNDYQLVYPGEMGRIDIYSMGPDGQSGTDDDIGNWNAQEYLTPRNNDN